MTYHDLTTDAICCLSSFDVVHMVDVGSLPVESPIFCWLQMLAQAVESLPQSYHGTYEYVTEAATEAAIHNPSYDSCFDALCVALPWVVYN